MWLLLLFLSQCCYSTRSEILILDAPNDPLSSAILISTSTDNPPFIYFQSLLYPPSALDFDNVRVTPNLYNAGGTFNVVTFPTITYASMYGFDKTNEDSGETITFMSLLCRTYFTHSHTYLPNSSAQ